MTQAPATAATPSSSHEPESTPSPSRQVKVVLVVRQGLPAPQAVNAAAVLGASVGTTLCLPLGPEAVDASGAVYRGIVTTPVPVLSTDAADLTRLYRQATTREDLTVLCLTETARRARSYEAYLSDLAATPESDTDIIGLIIAGPRNKVANLTRKLSLLV